MIYSSDNFAIAGVTLDNMPFLSAGWGVNRGVVDHNFPVYFPTYTLGLGLASAETAVYTNPSGTGSTFPTFVQQLVRRGVINSNAYSLWSDSLDGDSGHLLLGGINAGRFDSPLIDLATTLETRGRYWPAPNYLYVNLASLSVSNGDPQKAISLPFNTSVATVMFILSQENSQWTWLPLSLAQAIWDAVGAEYNLIAAEASPYSYLPSVPCSFMSNTSTLDITFKGAPQTIISVPMSSLVTHNGTGPTNEDGQYAKTSCVFTIGVADSSEESGFLGSSFLRSMYTVFDLQNNIISIASRNFTSTKDNIIEIPIAGVAHIPSSEYNLEQDSSSGLSSANNTRTIELAVGLGVGIPVILTLCLVVFYLWRRNKSVSTTDPKVDTVSNTSG